MNSLIKGQFYFTIRSWWAISHEADDCLGIFISLWFRWSSRIFSIVGQLTGTTKVTNSVTTTTTKKNKQLVLQASCCVLYWWSWINVFLRNHLHLYTTEAPPPATIVHILPLLLRIVSFSDAPLFASNSAIYASYILIETNQLNKTKLMFTANHTH